MPKSNQLTLFGVPAIRAGVFSIYHDESGTDTTHDRFQLHGALIVPEPKQKVALGKLNAARNGYQGRIHFTELRDRTKSLKAKVAWDWLRAFFGDLSNYCFYKCMIADTKSPSFDASKFSRPYHLYNYTAMLSVYSGVVWSLKGYDQVTLSLFSEETSRPQDDNFTSYLPRELANRANSKQSSNRIPHPQVVLASCRVTLVNGDPRKVSLDMAGHCEFIQLTDLITGAVAQAVNAKASQRIKVDLGEMVANWIEDSRLPPWLQAKDLHRRFSVSCFPDSKGGFYNVPLAIMKQGQPRLIDS